MTIVPTQLKIKNFFDKIYKLKNNVTVMSIQRDDKEKLEKYGIRLLN